MVESRSKVQELSIFTIGVGVLIAALSLWLKFAMSPQPGQQNSPTLLIVPLSISAVCILLGVLTLKLRSRMMIETTIGVVSLGLIIDLALGPNVVKMIISSLVILLILKTGREAVQEIRQAASDGTTNDLGNEK